MSSYGDWRDDIANQWSTNPPIPAHPYTEPGLWIDGGTRTADDGNREVIRIAEGWGLFIPDDVAVILDGSGWCDNPDDGETLIGFADYTATPYLSDVLAAYGYDANEDPDARDIFRAEWGTELDPRHPLVWWIGWDEDVGGFGLWIEPDDEWVADTPDPEHVSGLR